MAYSAIGGFPPQQLSFNRKNWVSPCKKIGLETKEFSDPRRAYNDHVYLVYMHVNKINGKVYVGITHHVNPNKRWGYSGQKYTHCIKFVHAINKYGWDNFDHIILCRTSKERAIIIEMSLIAHYKKLNMSYNVANGGEGSNAVSEETREKIRNIVKANHPMLGKHHTPEARALISKANRERVYTEEQKEQLRKAGELGRKTMRSPDWHLSEESRKKMIERQSFPVVQIDLNGNIIAEFKSAIEADRALSGGKGHHISDVCNGKRNTAYGFKWLYKKDFKLKKEGGQYEL